jgi:NTE family protein
MDTKIAKSYCDIVLEGGGVKGIGLVGALQEIDAAGYEVRRVAGTSAGAIVGSLLAAGMPIAHMVQLLKTLDYTKFRDPSPLSKFGWPGEAASLIFTKGIYEGHYLHDWLSEQLEKLGVQTFADLKITEDWAKDLPPERRYKLVVVASDISRGRMVRFPWDYAAYGLDPDKQPVANAVRASMSIPYFFQPAKLDRKLLVDGGMLSNFPIDSFDDTTEWPTFGIKLSAKENASVASNPVQNPLDFTTAILNTLIESHDRMHLDDPCTARRTIFVDTMDVKSINFDIKPLQQTSLFERGQQAAEKFLASWDYAEYLKACGQVHKTSHRTARPLPQQR